MPISVFMQSLDSLSHGWRRDGRVPPPGVPRCAVPSAWGAADQGAGGTATGRGGRQRPVRPLKVVLIGSHTLLDCSQSLATLHSSMQAPTVLVSSSAKQSASV